MAALIDRPTLRVVSRNIAEIVVAYLVALVALGGSLGGDAGIVLLAQVLLAIKLNVFALPLAATPVFDGVPLWAWYVAVVMWLLRFVQLSGYTTSEIISEVETAVLDATGRSQPRDPGVAADGGEHTTNDCTATHSDEHPTPQTMEEKL